MKPKQLTILFVVTVVVLLAAILVERGRDRSEDALREVMASFPTFTERVNDVHEIEVVAGGETATVRRDSEGWKVVDRGGYPAVAEKVKELVVRLSRLEVLEPKTTRPDRFAVLGLQDPEAEGSRSKRVTLRDADGADIVSYVIGDTKYRGRTANVFVRPAGQDRTFKCEGRLSLEADPIFWIEREVLKIESGTVVALEIRHADGETVRIERDGTSSDYAIQDIPAGKQASYAGSANGPATALAYVALDDVRPLDEVDFALEPIATATYTMQDGLVISVELARFEERAWARFQASFVAPGEGVGGDGSTASEDELEHARVEARALQREFDRWAYQLPDFKVEAIAKRSDDLLVDIEPEEADDSPVPTLPADGG